MSELSMKIASAFDSLPKPEQMLALEILTAMIRHWDPDFTKLTAEEESRLDDALKDDATVTLDELLADLN